MIAINTRRRLQKTVLGHLFFVVVSIGLTSCFLMGTEPEDSPLVDLANLLYLNGEWVWSDSVVYSQYVPDDDVVPHHGLYVVSGTATMETVDSVEVETYELTATAQVAHVDSTEDEEVTSWTITDIEYVDTVFVENDTIFGLSVEPIPPEANATTARIRWVFEASQLWCTNWLTDTIRPGNRDNCATTVTWTRSDSSSTPDTSSTGL